jgi:hypothetical protein
MRKLYWMILSAALLAGSWSLRAKERADATPAPDRIDVIAHIPSSGGPVVQLTTGTHWRRNYLYLEHAGGANVTILEVTDPTAPKTTAELTMPKPEAGGNVTTMVGTAALVVSSPMPPVAQTVTILSFADPERPTVVRQFSGVTAMLKDPSRGLTYLANSEGLWVLRADPAPDVEAEKEYDRYILYNH